MLLVLNNFVKKRRFIVKSRDDRSDLVGEQAYTVKYYQGTFARTHDAEN